MAANANQSATAPQATYNAFALADLLGRDDSHCYGRHDCRGHFVAAIGGGYGAYPAYGGYYGGLVMPMAIDRIGTVIIVTTCTDRQTGTAGLHRHSLYRESLRAWMRDRFNRLLRELDNNSPNSRTASVEELR